MNLPFPHISDHKTYPSTFLFAVEWRIHFNMVRNVQNYPFFRDFIKTTFGIELGLENFLSMSIIPLKYTRMNEKVKVKFTDNFAEFKFEADGYSSFQDSISPLLKPFLEMLKKINSEVFDMVCNKKNLLMIRRSEPGDEKELFAGIFSKELLSYPSYLLKKAELEEDQKPSARLIDISNSGNSLQIVYGAYFKKRDEKIRPETGQFLLYDYGLMMESQMKYRLQTNQAGNYIETAQEMNNYMYDLFRWAFNTDVYKAMESKPIEV
ncbi:MAG: hypothetical protein K2M37_08390 [Muribaculaceae bacterium]|nr:hypothetical protein [Muribaculaceae bacterium]